MRKANPRWLKLGTFKPYLITSCQTRMRAQMLWWLAAMIHKAPVTIPSLKLDLTRFRSSHQRWKTSTYIQCKTLLMNIIFNRISNQLHLDRIHSRTQIKPILICSLNIDRSKWASLSCKKPYRSRNHWTAVTL